jgi:hypothetical protein
MPVRHKPARPAAPPGPEVPRAPQESDADFTVLFERVPAQAKGASDRPLAVALTTTKGERAERAARAIDTMNVRPSLQTRIVRTMILLAAGGAIGIWVEVNAVGRSRAAGTSLVAVSPPPDARLSVAETRAQEPAGTAGVAERREAGHGVHHHHHHHHESASAPEPAPLPGAPADVRGDAGDDMAAAVQALSQAKGEITLP